MFVQTWFRQCCKFLLCVRPLFCLCCNQGENKWDLLGRPQRGRPAMTCEMRGCCTGWCYENKVFFINSEWIGPEETVTHNFCFLKVCCCKSDTSWKIQPCTWTKIGTWNKCFWIWTSSSEPLLMTPICLDSLDLRYHLVSQCANKLNPRISEHWEQNTVPPTTFPTFPQMRDSRQVLRHFRGFQRLRNLRVRSVAQDGTKVRILSSDGSHGCTSPGHLQVVIICKSVGKKNHTFFPTFLRLRWLIPKNNSWRCSLVAGQAS